MNTLQLSANWDLTLDANGNLAVVAGPQALAQDVASAISTFLGEAYFDTSLGVPWGGNVFAQEFSPALATSLIVQAAMSVPGVVSATVTDLACKNGVVTGTCKFTDSTGAALGVSF